MDAILHGLQKSVEEPRFTRASIKRTGCFATIVHDACLESIIQADRYSPTGSTDGRIIGDPIDFVIAESVRFPGLGRTFFNNGPVSRRKQAGVLFDGGTDLLCPCGTELVAEQFLRLLQFRAGICAWHAGPGAGTIGNRRSDAVVTVGGHAFLRAHRT